MADLFREQPVSIDDKIGSVRREIAMRRQVYPRWVANKKLTQDKADHEIRVMEAILADLEKEKAEQL